MCYELNYEDDEDDYGNQIYEVSFGYQKLTDSRLIMVGVFMYYSIFISFLNE